MVQKILIYDGSGGIGSATRRKLHARGYNLHLVGRDEERLADIARELGALLRWAISMTAVYLSERHKIPEQY